ncbi:MAG: magnesium/cobalt transporter CorA [Candidatus Micrarchaeota archaeon]
MALLKKRSSKAGLPPGTPVPVGERIEDTKISVIDYTPGKVEEKPVTTVAECLAFKDRKSVTWINVDGLADVKLLEKLGRGFGIHPLVMEDVLNTDQRPKVEEYAGHLYLVLKMLDYGEKEGIVKSEQVSIVLGPDFLLSFQESAGDVFDPVRDRIRGAKGRIRKEGPDYLAYTLIDMIVDHYFLILEKLGERIEVLESGIISNPSPKMLRELHKLKREMILLRKSVWPLREVISALERDGLSKSVLLKKSTKIYFRDVYDHCVQVIDNIETFREMLSGMLDIYLSSVSNKLNEVMKVLTVISTIFIPLTFVTGLYGMNFHFMPELSHPLGYPGALTLMFLMSLLMLFYFRRKRWI